MLSNIANILYHRGRTGFWVRAALAAGISVHLVLVVAFITVRQDRYYMDAITGSQEFETIWVFGMTSGPQIERSPLEMRLIESGRSWNQNWIFSSSTHRSIFGNTTCNACGSVPPIYLLSFCQKEFVAASTDDEIRQFVQIMETGSDQEQRIAIDAAMKTAIQHLESNSGQH